MLDNLEREQYRMNHQATVSTVIIMNVEELWGASRSDGNIRIMGIMGCGFEEHKATYLLTNDEHVSRTTSHVYKAWKQTLPRLLWSRASDYVWDGQGGMPKRVLMGLYNPTIGTVNSRIAIPIVGLQSH